MFRTQTELPFSSGIFSLIIVVNNTFSSSLIVLKKKKRKGWFSEFAYILEILTITILGKIVRDTIIMAIHVSMCFQISSKFHIRQVEYISAMSRVVCPGLFLTGVLALLIIKDYRISPFSRSDFPLFNKGKHLQTLLSALAPKCIKVTSLFFCFFYNVFFILENKKKRSNVENTSHFLPLSH